MANEEEPQGPRLVWTFPLVSRIQHGSRFLDFGSNIGSVMEDGGVGGRLQERMGSEEDEADVSAEDGDDVTSELQEQIDEVKEGSELAFGSSDDDEPTSEVSEVDIQDGVFIPTRANISEGDTVRWTNEDDSVHKLSSVKGEDFSSGQIEPGETFEHTFESEGVTVYVDTMTGGENMSGAVIVGDADSPASLPSETDEEFEPFEDEEEDDTSTTATTSGTRSMSSAADEKEDMDRGFGD